jgi:phage terminase large subunit-like protein
VCIITKQASGAAKVDALMALFNAVELMARNPAARGRSIYSDPTAWKDPPRKMESAGIFAIWDDEDD